MAIALKMDLKSPKVYSIHGDGELQEGSIWEAAMSASHYNLNNLIAIVDRNGLQIDGKTEDVMKLEPLTGKWRSFGWHVINCDGNDIKQILDAFKEAATTDMPTVIIAKTIMGKGILSIEGDYRWHGKVPGKEQAEEFIKELFDQKLD